jgi:hypothetical protein
MLLLGCAARGGRTADRPMGCDLHDAQRLRLWPQAGGDRGSDIATLHGRGLRFHYGYPAREGTAVLMSLPCTEGDRGSDIATLHGRGPRF